MQKNKADELIDILGAIELPDNILNTKEDNELLIKVEFSFKTKQKNINKTIDIKKTPNIKKPILKKIKNESKILKQFIHTSIFGVKYVLTSVLIFGVLLVSTNFSAYSNIIQSYVFENNNKQEASLLLNSVNAGEIKENIKKKKDEKKKEKRKNKTENKNKIKSESIQNNFSIKQIINEKNNNVDLGINIIPYENRIVIPKIGKNIPLIDIKETKVESKNKLDNIFMKELEEGIVRYPGSAKPGEKGNSFIFGHSSNFPWIAGDYNDVFARLGQMDKGDIIFSYYNQKKYKYKIKEKKVIKPTDVGVLKNNTNKKELTLMTCWPVGTTFNRLIIVAELIEE